MLVDQPSRSFKSDYFQRDMSTATEENIVLS